MKLEFSHKFSKSTLTKIRLEGAEFHARGRTGRQNMNLIVAFRYFGNAPMKTKLSTKERIQDSHFGSSHLVA
jgi:hypothetical protein